MRISLLLLFILCLTGSGCKKQYGEFYDPPQGQAGKIYEQLAANPSLSIFVSAIDKVPSLKDELNSSGLYTIMAPNNEAFKAYFESQQYKSIDQIPVNELSLIIKYHIMKYMLFQVNFMNPGLTKSEYDLYKYESRSVSSYNDVLPNGQIRSIYYPAKQLQVYTPYYFTSNNVSALDYKTVYGEDAEISASTQLNVMGASAIEKDIAAGNGVVHIINKVLLPPKNVAQEIDANPDFAQYGALFKKRFLTYTYNQAATKAQGNNGDVNGDGIVDSLFIRDYSGNTTIDAENPLNIEKKSISITAFIPSAAAFQNYMTTRFSEFPNWDDIPINTLAMLYNSHFTNTMDWPTKVLNGQSQSVGGDVINAAGHIMSVKMMSNGLLYQLDKVIEPAAFTTVTGPLYFSKNYNIFLDLLNRSGLIPILTNVNLKYTLLAPPTDQSLIDAGITYNATTNTYSRKKTGGISVNLGVTDIKALVGNHILLNGYSKSELTDGFYPTVNGTYLAVKGGKIEGSVRNVLATIDQSIQQSNGYFHRLDKAILDPEFSINELILQSLSGAVASPYRKFAELCVAAGLNTKDFLTITNVDAGKKFALFVPTNAKIIAAQNANLLPKTGAQGSEILTFERRARLINYIKFFFIENQVFTDGFAKGKASSTSPTAKPDVNGKVPLTVSYPSANVIMVQSGSNPPAGEVNLTNTDNAPQNVIAKDGVIQVIDNAFTSQY